MIIFNNFTENNDGLSFTSLFESKLIRLKIVDAYTGLIAWHDDMLVTKGSYFFSYPRRTNHYGFEISDAHTNETYLKINIYNDGYTSIEHLDKFGKLKDFKYEGKSEDLWAAYPLYDIFITKCYEHPKCKVEQNDVVIDIGANLGLFSYYAITKGAKKVYAFEPGESQSKAIKYNFGSCGNLVVEQKAVTSDNGILQFSKHKTMSILSGLFSDTKIDDNSQIGQQININNYEISECQSVNLIDYCKEKNIEKINFLKIDCEGSEYKIFESLNDDFIKSIDKITMEYHLNTDGRVKYLIEKLECNGFNVEVSDINAEVGNLIAYK